MADRARALPENVEGPIFVDATCIDCDTCRQLAPAVFGVTGEFSFVKLQPRDPAEQLAALRALVACPTGSIGTADKQRVPEAERVMDGLAPVELAPGFLAIPTPGHTRGHCALLAGERFLFSGDHIWWSRNRG